jgi:hypothetical protein
LGLTSGWAAEGDPAAAEAGSTAPAVEPGADAQPVLRGIHGEIILGTAPSWTEVVPGPVPLRAVAPANRITVPYSPTTFTDQDNCESYLPGGANENSSYPSGVISAAETKCCATGSTAKEFDSRASKHDLRCDADGASFKCTGADCDS